MDDEVVGWLSGPRSAVYHLDQTHAGDESLPVTDHDIIKFDLKPCSRCASPKHNEVPEHITATAQALRSMFVVEGTEDEVTQMARDFLDDLAEFGFRVTRIPQRKAKVTKLPTEGTGFDVLISTEEAVALTEPLDFSDEGDDEVEIVAELLEEGYGNGVASPGHRCIYFNGSARRCVLYDGHAGPHSYEIATPNTQEGSTE